MGLVFNTTGRLKKKYSMRTKRHFDHIDRPIMWCWSNIKNGLFKMIRMQSKFTENLDKEAKKLKSRTS